MFSDSCLAAAALAFAGGAVQAQLCEPAWSAVGVGADWEVRALAAFDEDGPGAAPPALYVGGGFSRLAGIDSFLIARWDGWTASPVGAGLDASDYGVAHLNPVNHSAGGIPAGLYVGGEIDEAGGLPVNNLVRWRAPEWHDVGAGVTQPSRIIPYVFATQFFDEDGTGPVPPALFVGGIFQAAAGVPVESLARWDGERWSDVGGGLWGGGAGRATVYAMAVYDDGRGPALYVAGSFELAGGKECWNIARWDGVEWEPVGPGINSTIRALCVYDEDGPGPKRPTLFAGGEFGEVVGGERHSMMRVGRWDGAEWTPVGGWNTSGSVEAFAVWDPDGPGPQRESLYMGGHFSRLPDRTPCNKIARWDGEAWHPVGDGVSGFGTGTGVTALAAFDEDGPGPNPGGLYVGGLFGYAGGVLTKHIARWGCPLPPSPCYADCDGSGNLNFFDFLCFQNLFAAADPAADCDGSGELDFLDFLCYQNAFIAGCP